MTPPEEAMPNCLDEKGKGKKTTKPDAWEGKGGKENRKKGSSFSMRSRERVARSDKKRTLFGPVGCFVLPPKRGKKCQRDRLMPKREPRAV